jgi:hypothetical protein
MSVMRDCAPTRAARKGWWLVVARREEWTGEVVYISRPVRLGLGIFFLIY